MLKDGAPSTWLRCVVGGETYALAMDRVAGLARSDRLEEPAFDDGIATSAEAGEPEAWLADEGARLPVFRLASRLGLSGPERQSHGPIVVLNHPLGRWGLMVDRVARATLAAPRPLPRIAHGPFFRAVARLADGWALVVDDERLHPLAPPSQPLPAESSPAEPGAPAMAAGPPPLPAEGSVLLFSTAPGGESPVTFGLALSQVKEVLRPQPLLRVPGAPAYCLGLASFRDDVVPVIDLSLRLGGGVSFFEGSSRLLVARGARVPQLLGLPVRTEMTVQALPIANHASSRPRLLDGSLVRGVFELHGGSLSGGTVFVPDLDRFLTQV